MDKKKTKKVKDNAAIRLLKITSGARKPQKTKGHSKLKKEVLSPGSPLPLLVGSSFLQPKKVIQTPPSPISATSSIPTPSSPFPLPFWGVTSLSSPIDLTEEDQEETPSFKFRTTDRKDSPFIPPPPNPKATRLMERVKSVPVSKLLVPETPTISEVSDAHKLLLLKIDKAKFKKARKAREETLKKLRDLAKQKKTLTPSSEDSEGFVEAPKKHGKGKRKAQDSSEDSSEYFTEDSGEDSGEDSDDLMEKTEGKWDRATNVIKLLTVPKWRYKKSKNVPSQEDPENEPEPEPTEDEIALEMEQSAKQAYLTATNEEVQEKLTECLVAMSLFAHRLSDMTSSLERIQNLPEILDVEEITQELAAIHMESSVARNNIKIHLDGDIRYRNSMEGLMQHFDLRLRKLETHLKLRPARWELDPPFLQKHKETMAIERENAEDLYQLVENRLAETSSALQQLTNSLEQAPHARDESSQAVLDMNYFALDKQIREMVRPGGNPMFTHKQPKSSSVQSAPKPPLPPGTKFPSRQVASTVGSHLPDLKSLYHPQDPLFRLLSDPKEQEEQSTEELRIAAEKALHEREAYIEADKKLEAAMEPAFNKLSIRTPKVKKGKSLSKKPKKK